VLFDTLCVSFCFVFFKFLVFEAAICANKDVYIITLAPDGRAEYCDERVCLCVIVCPRSYLRNYTSDLHRNVLHLLTMAVARSSSGGVVIYYVFPVL